MDLPAISQPTASAAQEVARVCQNSWGWYRIKYADMDSGMAVTTAM